MFQLTIKEEVFGTGKINEIPMHFSSERITVSDLIQQKVTARVKEINQDLKTRNISPFYKTTQEQVLNQDAIQKRFAKSNDGTIDVEKACYQALSGFQRNVFFVIVDGKQRENLKEELVLTGNSMVRFIQLMPLVGG
ncbi:MAG: hypothetical protein AB8F94_21695 [Saprospiraceae bacterium]